MTTPAEMREQFSIFVDMIPAAEVLEHPAGEVWAGWNSQHAESNGYDVDDSRCEYGPLV